MQRFSSGHKRGALKVSMGTIPVFYSEAMVANANSFSPSAGKPKALIDRWLRTGRHIQIIEPTPVTIEELCGAHDPQYVAGILECRISNGFGNKLPEVAKSLPYTSGSMLSAARWVLKHGGFACAPCSGFHHAGYDSSGGYCTFNGLVVAAVALKKDGATKVGILDFDMHYGDGTVEIIDRLRLDFIEHYTAGKYFDRVDQAEEFLSKIPALVESMKDCDVILYQAGADQSVDDPLGGFLTTEQLARRDNIVFETAARLKLPLAYCLAGGYSKPLERVLDIHDNTLLACAKRAE